MTETTAEDMTMSSGQMQGQSRIRFSVVIPTFNRREIVSLSLLALERQRFREPFEVIVVVDGSTDGTAERLRALDVSFPLTVVEQRNSGASMARNRGAEVARGEILLFLDDDMEADPSMLAEHDRSHRAGADVVIGHLPLHPDSPDGPLNRSMANWAAGRLDRLSRPGAPLTLHDLLTGQLSVAKETFHAAGGFDPSFTRDGAFGNEDIDFGYRLLCLGYRVEFNPGAVSWQRYVVQPAAYLRQWRDAGRADVAFARKHPERAAEIFASNGADHWTGRYVCRLVLSVPGFGWLALRAMYGGALALSWSASTRELARRFLKPARSIHYWAGICDAGGIPRSDCPRVLAYHSIAQVSDDSPLAPYTVAPALFEKQLDTLLAAGFHFVDADAVLDYVSKRRVLPTRAVLLTFDDCYADLLPAAFPILLERRIPAVAFAVSSQIGGLNAWDLDIGAPELQLLDVEGLRTVAEAGIEIGAHSRTHRSLTGLSKAELDDEVAGCIAEIEATGLPRPRLFSYPYGEWNRRVASAQRAAGVAAAFTVQPTAIRAGSNPMALPRIPIFSTDVGEQFALSISGAAHRGAQLRPEVRAMYRDLLEAWNRTTRPRPAPVPGRNLHQRRA